MRVTWSRRAIRRVVEYAEYIALDKPGAAERWLEGAFEAVEPLSDFPWSGRVVPELGREDIRELLCGAYRMIYRVFPGEQERPLVKDIERDGVPC
jgi:plasmid stabilization system protein ParE